MKMSLRGEAEAISKDEIPRYTRNDRKGGYRDDEWAFKNSSCGG